MIESDRLISANSQNKEAELDRAIRPKKLLEYIGQAPIREQMDIFISAARGRQEPLDHTLLFDAGFRENHTCQYYCHGNGG